jgi:hypothetical protein
MGSLFRVWSSARYVGGWSLLNSGNEVVFILLSRALVSTTSTLLLLLFRFQKLERNVN